MGEGSGRGSGRVWSSHTFCRHIAGRVNVSPGRVGSGPRKVTHGQLCATVSDSLAELHLNRMVHAAGAAAEFAADAKNRKYADVAQGCHVCTGCCHRHWVPFAPMAPNSSRS